MNIIYILIYEIIKLYLFFYKRKKINYTIEGNEYI